MVGKSLANHKSRVWREIQSAIIKMICCLYLLLEQRKWIFKRHHHDELVSLGARSEEIAHLCFLVSNEDTFHFLKILNMHV
jgi:hypothetical protein